MDVILLVRVKSCRYENEIRLEVNQVRDQVVRDSLAPLLRSGGSWDQRIVVDASRRVSVPLLLISTLIACVWVETSSMQMQTLK